MTAPTRPVLFVHGLWLHASSWQNWIELFTDAGYAPCAPGWPGDGETVAASRENPGLISGYGFGDVVEHYAATIRALDVPPILIGHSFGGTIVQKLLGQGLGAAAVAIDPAPIKGVLPLPISTLRASFPALRNPANHGRAVSLTPAQFRYAFANTVTEAESAALFEQWTVPSPGKPLFQAAVANFNPRAQTKVDTGNRDRGPLLVTSGGRDHTVPAVISRATVKQYAKSAAVTELLEFTDRGHSLTIDSGWREVAEAVLTWLTKQSL